MSDNLQTFTRALHTLRNVAVRVPTASWDNQSCCSGWSAREVAGHASWVVQSIAASASGSAGPAEQPEAAVAGDDPAATICSSVDACLAALDQPGVLKTVAQTPFGEMPIDNFLGSVWFDPLTHAWDIADAAGIDSGIDADTAAMAKATCEPLADMGRSAGIFGAEVQTTSADPVDQMIAFSGRRSVRS